jgi:hypothetical protein
LAALAAKARSSFNLHLVLALSMRSMVRPIMKIRMALDEYCQPLNDLAWRWSTHAIRLKTPSQISSLAPKRSLTWVNHCKEVRTIPRVQFYLRTMAMKAAPLNEDECASGAFTLGHSHGKGNKQTTSSSGEDLGRAQGQIANG